MYSALLIAVAAIGVAVVFGGEAAGYPTEARRLPVLLAWIVAGLAVLDDGRERRSNGAGVADSPARTRPTRSTAS